jgi:predicted enzyme related to lactoylglutathione lyase
MHRLVLCLSLVLVSFSTAFAQLTPVNESGVTIGHVHWLVPDPEAHKKLWIELFGAQLGRTGSLEFLKIPGVVILINKGNPAAVTGEPTADHFAIVVKDLAEVGKKLSASNIRLTEGGMAAFPDGVRIEILEDKSLAVPVAFHHFHIYAADAEALQNWYVRTFGGIKFPAGPDIPGGEVRFTAQSNPPRVPSKGHAFDHISFEIKGLPEFCKKIETQGTKLDMAIIDAPQIGLKVTFVTDPAGTRIELTEGFAGK